MYHRIIEKVPNIEPKGEMGRTPLHYAAEHGQLEHVNRSLTKLWTKPQ
jgi:ankyrin repeat protein